MKNTQKKLTLKTQKLFAFKKTKRTKKKTTIKKVSHTDLSRHITKCSTHKTSSCSTFAYAIKNNNNKIYETKNLFPNLF